VPWFFEAFRGPDQSICKGRWLEIRHGLKACYAQWEDVGPFHTDLAGYVFGDERPSPNLNHGAGDRRVACGKLPPVMELASS